MKDKMPNQRMFPSSEVTPDPSKIAAKVGCTPEQAAEVIAFMQAHPMPAVQEETGIWESRPLFSEADLERRRAERQAELNRNPWLRIDALWPQGQNVPMTPAQQAEEDRHAREAKANNARARRAAALR